MNGGDTTDLDTLLGEGAGWMIVHDHGRRAVEAQLDEVCLVAGVVLSESERQHHVHQMLRYCHRYGSVPDISISRRDNREEGK